MADITNNNLVYVGTGEPQEFNKEYANSLVAKKDRRGLVEYMKQFEYIDPSMNDSWLNGIDELEQEANKYDYFYQQARIKDDRLPQVIQFAESVYDNNTLSELEESNEVVKTWNNGIRQLGSRVADNGDIEREAIGLSVTFSPKVQGRFGKNIRDKEFNGFWGTINDYLNPDNGANIDAFCQKLGITPDQLYDFGITAADDVNGNTTIKFNKNNPQIARIVEALGDLSRGGKDRGVFDDDLIINGIDAEGNIIKPTLRRGRLGDSPLSVDLSDKYANLQLSSLSNMLSKAKEERDNIWNEIEGERYYNIKTYGFRTETLAELARQRDAGALSGEEYNSRVKTRNEQLDLLLGNLSLSNYNIYTNYLGKGDWDTQVHDIGDVGNNKVNKTILTNMIHDYRNFGDIETQVATFGRKSGTLITLIPSTDTQDAKKAAANRMESGDEYDERNPRTIFVEGLFINNDFKQQINKDNVLKARFDIEDMAYYGYPTTLQDGSKLKIVTDKERESNPYVNMPEAFVQDVNGNTISLSKDAAEMLLAKSYGIKMATRELMRRNVGRNGQILDNNRYNYDAQNAATSIVLDLFDMPNALHPAQIFGARTPDEADIRRLTEDEVSYTYADIIDQIISVYRELENARDRRNNLIQTRNNQQ